MTAPVELSPPPNGPMLVAEGPERKLNSESPGLDPLAGRDLDALITDPVCQRLFRLFLVFAGDNLVRCPDGRLLRCVSRAQARFLLSQIGQLRDQMQICPNRPLPSVHSEEDAQFQINGQNSFPDEQMRQSQLSCASFSDQVTFRELLGHALTLCPRRLQFSPLIDRLFARYVLQIVRKGFLLCRPIRPLPRALRPFSCCLLPPANARSSPAQQLGLLHSRGSFRCRPSAGPWRPFWCVLMPGQLQLWPLGTPKSGKGGQRLPLDAELESAETGGRCWTLKLDKDSQLEISDLDGGGQLFGWLLATRSSLVELAHFDQLQRQLWIADLEMVVRKRRPSLLLQFDRLNSRRPVSQLTERRSPSVGRQQLQKENRALVELLEAERRALKDEEMVRQLATRMLDEEVQRGDSLRQTVECLASQLEMEREQRQLLEHSIIEQQELQQQQQQKQPEQPILSQNAPNGEQSGKLDANNDEDACLDIPVLVPFDRLITPQPRARKGGKRLRDSIRNKKEKARKELGQELPVEEQRKESREVPVTEERGEELKVVNVGPRPPPKPGPKPKRNLEKEQKKLEAESAQRGNEELAENGQELFAGIYDQATLRATDYWDATKPPPQPPNGINAVDANFLMAMSTRSV